MLSLAFAPPPQTFSTLHLANYYYLLHLLLFSFPSSFMSDLILGLSVFTFYQKVSGRYDE